MAAVSRQAFERLEDENRGICQKLADTESELVRRENELKAANTRKTELLNDLCELQRKIKDLKAQLEKAENLEMEAKVAARDSQQTLVLLQNSVRDQSASSKACIATLQQEIRSLKTKLAEKEEQYDSVQAKLRQREDRLHELEMDKSKMGREGSSKITNLNDALAQSKHTNSQLADENSALKRNEQELVKKCELLEQRYNELSASNKSKPCQRCVDRELHQTPARMRSCTTPVKAVPEQSLADTLQIENAQLKQDLQCIQVNFQLTCQKSTQFKQELKEAQQALSDLKADLERALSQKEEAERKLEEMRLALLNKSESDLGGKQRSAQMQKEVSSLREQLESLEQQNRDLQSKLKGEASHGAQAKDQLLRLEARIKTLTDEKQKVEGNLRVAQNQLIELNEQLSLQLTSSTSQDRLQRQAAESIGAYEHKLLAAKAAQENCQQELGSLQKVNGDLRSELDSLTELKKTQEARITALEASNQALNNARKERDPLFLQEIDQLKCALAQLTDEKQAMETEQAKLTEACQKSELHIQELNKTNKRLQREANHNWELSKKLQKELEKYETNYLKSEEGCQEKQQQLLKVSKEAEDAKLELVNAKKAKEMYEMQVSKLIKRVEELEQADFELNAKLGDVQVEATSAKVTQSEAQRRLEEALKKYQTMEMTYFDNVAQVKRLEVATELMEQENTTLLMQVNSLSEMLATRNARIDELQAQITRYELESKDIVLRVCELEEEHGRCKELRERLQNEVSDLKDSLTAARDCTRAGESVISSAKLDMKQVQEYNTTLEAVNSGLQQKIQNQYTQIEELMSSNSVQEKKLHDVEQLLKVKESLLKDALEDAKFAANNAHDIQTSLRNRLDTMESKLHDLQKAFDEAERDKKDLCDELLHVQSEMKEERHTCQVIRGEREALVDKYECTKAEIDALKEKLLLSQQSVEDAKRELVQEKQCLAEVEREKCVYMTRVGQLEEQYEQLKDKTLTLLDDSGENRAPKRVKREVEVNSKSSLKAKPTIPKSALKPIQNIK